jgi:hypothetical protein
MRASGVVKAIGLGVAVIAIAHPDDRSNAFCFSLDAAHAAIHISYLSEEDDTLVTQRTLLHPPV